MSSTHYMDLLMQNSPWNLILFMAIPVVLAETIAITELLIPLLSERAELTKKVNRVSGVLAGIAFIGIILYLVPAVVLPLASNGEFRTWVDAVAIFSYLLAGIPMILLALLNSKLLFKHAEPKKRNVIRISLLAAFLVLSHIAMIFGMVDPSIAGYQPEKQSVEMNQSFSPSFTRRYSAGFFAARPFHARPFASSLMRKKSHL